MEKALNKQLQMETNVALGCLNQSFLSPPPQVLFQHLRGHILNNFMEFKWTAWREMVRKQNQKAKHFDIASCKSPQNQFNIRRGLICNRLLTAEISPSPTREWGRVGGAVGNSEGCVRCRNKQPNENEAEVIFRWRCSKHNHIKKKKKAGAWQRCLLSPFSTARDSACLAALDRSCGLVCRRTILLSRPCSDEYSIH